MIAIGNFLFRYRNAVFPVACLLLFLPGPRLFAKPLLAVGLGAVVAGCGQLARAVTIGLRYIVRGGRGGHVYADELVTEGIYTLCRNPMYVGNVLIVAGVAMASNSVTTLVCAVLLAVFAYAAIVAAEERYLRSRFGAAYEAYCADVPRWLPRSTAVRSAFAACSFHWRRVFMKEYGTPFGWVNAMCLVALYNLWRENYLQDSMPEAHGLLAIMGVVTLFWLTARVLKKTRRVIAD